MSTNEPCYLSCFEVKLLAFSCHMIFPGKSAEVNSQIFDLLDLRNDCLVDVQWGGTDLVAGRT